MIEYYFGARVYCFDDYMKNREGGWVNCDAVYFKKKVVQRVEDMDKLIDEMAEFIMSDKK